jgi:Tfp pilus assembly pilus retraction ATPase PilT
MVERKDSSMADSTVDRLVDVMAGLSEYMMDEQMADSMVALKADHLVDVKVA